MERSFLRCGFYDENQEHGGPAPTQGPAPTEAVSWEDFADRKRRDTDVDRYLNFFLLFWKKL